MLKRLVTSLTVTLGMVGVLAVLLARLATALPDDGRINVVTHFGGDALYCVDGNFNPTNDYADFEQGGFRLLDQNGQALWFVPAAQVVAAVQGARDSGTAVLVDEGVGSHGPVQLVTYVNGAIDTFVLTGYDEYGKLNSLTFTFCTPVGPIRPTAQPSDDGDDFAGDNTTLTGESDGDGGETPPVCPEDYYYNPETGKCSSGVVDIGPGISSDDGLPV